MKKVIDYKNRPEHFPIVGTITWYLLFDKLDLPAWAWGIAGTLAILVWAGICWDIYTQEKIDIFSEIFK